MSRLITLLFGVGIAAAAIYYRREIRERAAIAAGKTKGAVATAMPSEEVDDKTLAHKVETEIFRAPEAPKGDVSVDVQAGVVTPARRGRRRAVDQPARLTRRATSTASRASTTCSTRPAPRPPRPSRGGR